MADSTKHLLLVEDEVPLREAVAEQLTDRGFEVVQADSAEGAIERLADFAFDVVITDLRLPGQDGTRVIEAAVKLYPDIIGVVMTGYGTVKDAVEVIKRGAADFVTKPFQFDELWHALLGAIEQRRLRTENAWLREQLEQRHSFEGIVGGGRARRPPRGRRAAEGRWCRAPSTTPALAARTASSRSTAARSRRICSKRSS